MTVLIQKAVIVDPTSPHHGKTMDILVDSGMIKAIQPVIEMKADQVVQAKALHVSPGWVDVFASFGDPGYEYKETLETGADAAAAGGFTDVFVVPNTKPVTDTKSQVNYIKSRSQGLVQIHPIGAISKKTEGQELAEMYDMRSSGAIAFSDGTHPVQSAGLLVKALQYVRTFDGVIIQIPDDSSIAPHGLMHEGIVSTRIGLAGKPMMAEELCVARDIKLARYAQSKLHFTGVTSPRSLDYIRRAKEAGLSVTCSVTPYHLFFSDEDLMGYDTNLKVYPPLRTRSHIDALKKALVDGTIDCIATHHLPHEKDSKVTEFEYAAFGMIGLETCYPALKTAVPDIPETRWVELLSTSPRKIFGLPPATVDIGKPASLTLFEPNAITEVNDKFLRSRSRNTPFMDKQLKGKVKGLINGANKIIIE